MGVPHPAPHSLPAPWGRGRERGGWAPLSAAASLEDRGGGADEGGHGQSHSGGPFSSQLTVLLGAGLQVHAPNVSCPAFSS